MLKSSSIFFLEILNWFKNFFILSSSHKFYLTYIWFSVFCRLSCVIFCYLNESFFHLKKLCNITLLPLLYHSCTDCTNLEMEPNYLTKSDIPLKPNISVTYLPSHFHLIHFIYQSSSIHFMYQSPTHSFCNSFPSHSFYRP